MVVLGPARPEGVPACHGPCLGLKVEYGTGEGSIEVEGAMFTVAKELMFQSKPDGAGGGRILPNDLLKVGGDGAKEPHHDNAVHSCLVRVGVIGDIGEDMALE